MNDVCQGIRVLHAIRVRFNVGIGPGHKLAHEFGEKLCIVVTGGSAGVAERDLVRRQDRADSLNRLQQRAVTFRDGIGSCALLESSLCEQA